MEGTVKLNLAGNGRYWFLAELRRFDKDYKGRLVVSVRNVRFLADEEAVVRLAYSLIVKEYPNLPLGSTIKFEAKYYEFESQRCITWADKFEVVNS